MSDENKEKQTDQLLRGIYRMCVNRDDCSDCPFYITKCMFEEPKPRTWFDEDTIAVRNIFFTGKLAEESVEEKPVVSDEPAEEQKPAEVLKPADDSDGTWLVSTTMGSVFTKYVFICSKCGYRKESIFSITPMTFCPECEKRKAGQV